MQPARTARAYRIADRLFELSLARGARMAIGFPLDATTIPLCLGRSLSIAADRLKRSGSRINLICATGRLAKVYTVTECPDELCCPPHLTRNFPTRGGSQDPLCSCLYRLGSTVSLGRSSQCWVRSIDKGRTLCVHCLVDFRFADEKNRRLAETRGVTFEDVIEAIAEYGVLAEYQHPNQQKYPGQRVMVVRIGNYPHCVPFSVDGETICLKTVYPGRRFRYLIEGERHG